MMTSLNGNIFRVTGLYGNSPVTGEFPAQRPVTRSFDIFFDLPLNKRLSKQSWGWWFETPSRSLWRHCSIFPRYHADLTRWGRAMHICVSKLTIIGSDNDLSPGRRQAIIWTSDGIFIIGHLGTTLSEILTFSSKKMHLKMSSAKWCPFCLHLNVLSPSALDFCWGNPSVAGSLPHKGSVMRKAFPFHDVTTDWANTCVFMGNARLLYCTSRS